MSHVDNHATIISIIYDLVIRSCAVIIGMVCLKNLCTITSLKVYCSLKGKGCDWSGMVDQLKAHLDPDLDNCQYVDTKCPLNCQQAIPKNKVEQHLREECVKREHLCQHCNFKATYEEVVDTHLPECMYVTLQCPNLCGVSCDH